MFELQTVQDLFTQTLEKLYTGSWQEFLKTAAWTFKYKFPDQLLIYAQRPEATACASIDVWNHRLHRTVREDARHIALIDDSGDRIDLKYVVDVSDTDGLHPIPLWKMTFVNQNAIFTALADHFSVKAEDYDTPTAFFRQIASQLADSSFDKVSFSLRRIRDDCLGVQDLTAEKVEALTKDLLVASLTAVMMYRCDLEPEFSPEEEEIFSNITLFTDTRAISILGQTTQAMSREALMIAAQAVKDWEKTHREEIYHGSELSESRGVSDSRIENESERTSEQVRPSSEEISAGASPERIYGDDADRTVARGSDHGRPGDRDAYPSADHGTGENRSGAEQGSEQYGLDKTHDEVGSVGGRTDLADDSLRLNEILYPDASQHGIHVSFPTPAQQSAAVAQSLNGFLIPQDIIDQVITSDFKRRFGWEGSDSIFAAESDSGATERAVRAVYVNYEDDVPLLSGEEAHARAEDVGLRISMDDGEARKEAVLPWIEVCSRIRTLMETGRLFVGEAPHEQASSVEDLHVGQQISLRGVEYLVTRISEQFITLRDIKHPIFTNPMPRSALDVLLRREARVAESAPETESEQTSEVSEEISAEEGANSSEVTSDVKEEPSLSEPVLSSDAHKGFWEKISETAAQRNYRFLEYYAPEFMDGRLDYIRFESDTFEPLYIERIGEGRIAIAHTYVQNGDLMYDPEIVFEVDAENEELLPLSFEQSNPPIYRSVFDNLHSAHPRKDLAAEQSINAFFRTWSQNLIWQEHTPVRGIRYGRDQDIEYTFDGNRELLSSEKENSEAQTIEESSNLLSSTESSSSKHNFLDTDEPAYTAVSFHEGDYYEDDHTRGIITGITLPSEESHLAGMFSLVDPDAPEDSREGRGYVMSMPVALQRLNRGEATLIPNAAERNRSASEHELTLFDFVYDEPESAAEPLVIEEKSIDVRSASYVDPNGRIDFRIPLEQENYGGPKARYLNNVAAIRLLKELESEDRLATPHEQQILSKYVGWGGIPQAFDPQDANWSKEYLELRELLSEDEYNRARESTLTAFYTPPEVTEAIFTALENFGFRKGNILDPCCGTGNFFGMLPETMRNSKLYGVELDSISGRIGRQLYQNANILIDGYEKTSLPDSFYDVAIGNVPFGNFKLHDKRYDKENFLIHDYFFAKTLDKVRPGGIVAFVTSKGTMDKVNDSVRRYISQRADLLGAIRLPNNTFKMNAGTEAVSDILFLKKRSRPAVRDEDWVGLDREWLGFGKYGPLVNAYFAQNPEMVLGDLVEVSGPHGPELTCTPREGEDLRQALLRAVSNISGEIEYNLDAAEEEVARESIQADPSVRNFSYTLVDGDVYFREDSQMFRAQLNKTAEQRVKGLIELRDITRDLIDAQTRDAPAGEIMSLQSQLNTVYDRFTKKYGLINSRANDMAFSDDSSYFLLCSLEHIDDDGNFLGKADMFYKRTIGPHSVPEHTETAQEALAVCIGERGHVDLKYICSLCGQSEQEALVNLKGLIFPVPGHDGTYELSSIYLSGNVRRKLEIARTAAQNDPRYTVNVEYLEEVLPEPLAPEDISARLGSTWIPADDVTDFFQELLDFDQTPYLKDSIRAFYEPITDTWTIKNSNSDYRTVINTAYGTERVNAYKLIEDALNQKNTQVFDSVEDADGKARRVLNMEETVAARDKQEMIKQKFKDWLWSDPARAERLSKIYNERFNSIVTPEYDENMIVFHGINPYIELEKHQKEAVARILYGGNTQLAHCVGAGKTWTMVAAAMEGKHLGLCNKSLIVVPNHLVGQWASAIYDLYPSANVLASTKKDFETKNRKKFCSRIATGDYDIVVIGHSQFERIPLSKERQEATLQEQIDSITESVIELKDNDGEPFSIKQMERMKKSLNTKLERLQNGKKRDDVITFEELGVDRLFIDESHEYKNLFLYTKMYNVAGISQTDSQKASDLFMKCRYMDEITGNKGNIHATGTPLSNTMAELYTTQRYLQYDLLNEMGLGSFDAWASTFGETVQSIELAPEGTGYRERTRFANFFNIPELMSIYKQVADIRTADMLNLPVPEAEYHTVVVPASEEQKTEVQKLAERADNIRQRKVKDNREDNMLCITNDGRKLALDQRLMNPDLPDNPNSKVNACVDSILEYYTAGEEDKLTQLVFCDLSTPNSNSFNVYQDLKDKLIARGIPADEIRFIHEANTDAAKEALFSKVRSGAVRVLIGSTTKMGTGTNAQDRLIASHDLDCPWRPSDLEQRAGRTIRRGNQNDKVHILRYVTENTFDAYMYQLIEAKQRFASQIFTSKSPVRKAADVDESVLNYSQIKALASGNPKIREKIELEIEIARLKSVENSYKREQRHLKHLIQSIPEQQAKIRARLSGLKADEALLASTPGRTEEGSYVPVEVQGVTYDKQTDAGIAIFESMKNLSEQDKWFCIGHLRGFRIMARQPITDTSVSSPELALVGKRSYPVDYGDNPKGLMMRMNNILDDVIPSRIKRCEKEIRDLSTEYASAKKEFGKPFAAAEQLKAKNQHLKELEIELNLDMVHDSSSTVGMDKLSPEGEHPSLDNMISMAAVRSAQQSANGLQRGRDAVYHF